MVTHEDHNMKNSGITQVTGEKYSIIREHWKQFNSS